MDPAQVAALYERFGPELRRFLFGVLGDDEAANDALQAVFAKAAAQGGMARPHSLKGWLFRVAVNEAMLIRRRAGIDARAKRRLAAEQTRNEFGPDAPLVRRETIERVRQALDELPGEQRIVVHARVYENKTFAQIADELELPLGTVLTRMRLALQKLRRALESEEG
jgi:RNA polymerase sigma-70 factor (ECF subfamily)